MRKRKRHAEFCQGLGDGGFVLRVRKRKKQANGDRLRLFRPQPASEFLKIVRRNRLHDFAIARDSLGDAKTHLAGNQRRNPVKEEVVELGPGLAADFENVFKSRCGHQRRARSGALQQGVGADGGAVQQRKRLVRSGDFRHALENCPRRVVGSGEHFEQPYAATLHPNAIGEGAAGVDSDAKRFLRAARHG